MSKNYVTFKIYEISPQVLGPDWVVLMAGGRLVASVLYGIKCDKTVYNTEPVVDNLLGA